MTAASVITPTNEPESGSWTVIDTDTPLLVAKSNIMAVGSFPPVQTLITAGDDSHATRTYEVWTPWLAVIMSRNYPYIYATKGRLRSHFDHLYAFPFPHLT